MTKEKGISYNANDIEKLKERMRNLSQMNQELRLKNSRLQKHLDDAMAQLFQGRIETLEAEHEVKLKPITFENARTILFTDAFNQLAYLKEKDLLYVSNKNRQWVYDNAKSFKWFIYREREQKGEQSALPLEADDAPNKSFKETFHEVRIQDLPAYLKLFRYYEKKQAGEIGDISPAMWASYERGKNKPNRSTIERIEKATNIKIINDASFTTINFSGFGERLGDLMHERRMTRSNLAKKVGITHSAVTSYIDKGIFPLAHRGVMNDIADALGVSICYLLTGTKEWE